ncbi:hypothetical protein K1719_007779 [Acacia pycnantha]|nr:hypothetical protein K1719_007779 [Acacia pycnantha]
MLQKINEGQKKAICKSERALRVAEEEMVNGHGSVPDHQDRGPAKDNDNDQSILEGDESNEEMEVPKCVDATMLLHELPYTEDKISRVHASRRLMKRLENQKVKMFLCVKMKKQLLQKGER